MVARELKVPVTHRALVQRINRKLQSQDDPEYLRAARTDRQRKQVGDWYVTDCMGTVVYADLDLEKFGRKLQVLADYEQLVED